ncbi:hypothetical protein [Anaerophaga thermohalophila]|jgi:hypothetical protein|nr:hypothetical protein [Anaerophaga thermohalophila]
MIEVFVGFLFQSAAWLQTQYNPNHFIDFFGAATIGVVAGDIY